MNYPLHLLPQYNYKKISWSNELEKCSLIRHTDTKDIFMEGTKNIDIDKIKFPSKQFKHDLSTNLLSVFCLNDIFIQIINNELIKNWEPEEDIYYPSFEKDFVINNERAHFALFIKDILLLNSAETVLNQNLCFKIFHSPTKCNFWHFSIRLCKNGISVADLDISEKNKERLWRSARIWISHMAYYIDNEFYNLSKEHYCKQDLSN